MKGPLDIHQFLLAHDVHHEIVRLRRHANTDHLAEVLGVTPRRCVALHPYRAGTTSGDVLVVLLAPADEPIEDALVILRLSDVLRHKLGDPLLITRARGELVSSITDYLASHLAPLLLPAEVVVVTTRALSDLASAIVYTPTGDGGTALGIRACDLIDLAHATVLPEAPVRQRRRPARIDLDQPAAIRLDEPEPTHRPTEPRTRDAMRSRDTVRPRDTPRPHDVSRPHDDGSDAVAPRRRIRAVAANVRSGPGTPLTAPATAAG